MSTQEPGYVVQAQVHINQLNPDTGSVEAGWEVRVKDRVTGVVVPVFVPDAFYGGAQAAVYIEHALKNVRDVHALGG